MMIWRGVGAAALVNLMDAGLTAQADSLPHPPRPGLGCARTTPQPNDRAARADNTASIDGPLTSVAVQGRA